MIVLIHSLNFTDFSINFNGHLNVLLSYAKNKLRRVSAPRRLCHMITRWIMKFHLSVEQAKQYVTYSKRKYENLWLVYLMRWRCVIYFYFNFALISKQKTAQLTYNIYVKKKLFGFTHEISKVKILTLDPHFPFLHPF